MRILYVTDRLAVRGGADQHLAQVITTAAGAGLRVTVAYGRSEAGAVLPAGVAAVRVKGLAAAVSSGAGLGELDRLVEGHDLVHVQNVMNPLALRIAVGGCRAVVTVQDHRVFCPGMGKTLSGGAPCTQTMGDVPCARCLPDDGYRARTLELTADRRDAIRGARLLALSHYMADELVAAGLPGASVLPPWVEVGDDPPEAGHGFVLGGRLVRHKGVLDAWSGWRASGTDQPLRVAGAGPHEADLVGCELLGWLPAGALRRTLGRARAVLFPSCWQEPFGILGIEALAEGTPVIVADSGGTREWSGTGCLRVPQGDVRAMAKAVRRLADDPDLALRLGAEGQAMVAERFARGAITARLLELYRKEV